MTLKFIVIFTFIAASNAGGNNQMSQHVYLEHQPSLYQHIRTAPEQQKTYISHTAYDEYPNDPHPAYNFEYKVDDSISGDSKSQTETRNGDVVQGEYSLIDADGFRRTVKYTADDTNGFNAVVQREPISVHKVLTTNHASSVHVTPLDTTQYHNAPTAYVAPKTILQAPIGYATPSYTAPVNLQAHPEQYSHAQTYTTYGSPEQQLHKSQFHH